MPHELKKKVYYFNELSDEAKEKAREWYREGAFEWNWWDFVYEDAKYIGAILGIDITDIYFSGFWNQGDGACFTGSYSYAKGWRKKLEGHCPKESDVFEIGEALQKAQRELFYNYECSCVHQGHYNHSGCMKIIGGVEDHHIGQGTSDQEKYTELEGRIQQALREFADWIYSQLEKQYDWMNSDEQVDETILANEYEFDKEGNREC